MNLVSFIHPTRTYLPCTGVGRHINNMLLGLAARPDVDLSLLVSAQWVDQDGKLDSRMPHRRLFDHYALAGRPRAEKVRWHLRHAVDALWRLPSTWVRQNRLVNTFYHRNRK